MDDPVAVPLEIGAEDVLGFGTGPALGVPTQAGPGRKHLLLGGLNILPNAHVDPGMSDGGDYNIEMIYNGPGMITQNVRRILEELPPGVELVAAAKGQPAASVLESIEAGIRIIGENYVQEAVGHFAAVGARVRWHFIGRLQRNKAKRAAEIFDMIETVDSVELAAELDKRCAAMGKILPVLVEVNSGREPQKAGVLPERAEGLVREMASFGNLRLEGLMTMGPFEGDPEDARPFFRETRLAFEALRALSLPGVSMSRLSMGMTNSYRIALEEGATMVRIGTKIFGARPPG